jgi:hypothetical protein
MGLGKSFLPFRFDGAQFQKMPCEVACWVQLRQAMRCCEIEVGSPSEALSGVIVLARCTPANSRDLASKR